MLKAEKEDLSCPLDKSSDDVSGIELPIEKSEIGGVKMICLVS